QLDPRTRIVLEHESEVALAKKLLQFADVLPVASGEEPVGPASSAGEPAPRPAPHLLTNYLFETSQAFSAFYRNCPVLRAADCQLRNSRLRLCDLAARTLKTGLQLLGIETLDRM
ncbi:MAG: DALR anticodon-binding domain-containing protein, partial [Phycisphaerae bacterium]